LVGKLVLESVKAGKHPSSWSPEQLAAFAPEFTPDMARLFQPAEGMKTRTVPGGTAPSSVAAALDEAEQRLALMKERLSLIG
jgi:argininosuccinate lyase